MKKLYDITISADQSDFEVPEQKPDKWYKKYYKNMG